MKMYNYIPHNCTQLTSRLSTLLLAGVIVLFSPSAVFSQANGETHTVRSGETLFSISQQYDVTVSELRSWNDLDEDELRTGMTLRVAPPESQNAITHTVSSQETLFSISRRYGVTVAEIQQWNNLNGTLVSTGQELIIYTDGSEEPGVQPLDETRGVDESQERAEDVTPPAEWQRESIVTPSTGQASSYYTVQSGDNLNKIAAEHGMTTDELRRLNNLEGDLISVGQRLIVHETQGTPVVDEEFEESTPQGRFVTYRVESGENASRILDRFSMNREELEALNPGTDITSLSSGQRITVLLPPSQNFRNPYRKSAGLENLGEVTVSKYRERTVALPTSSGELYNPGQLTAAHANMSLGSIVYVENPANGRGIYVKVNDRFPGDGIKLSERAFEMLGYSPERTSIALIYQEGE